MKSDRFFPSASAARSMTARCFLFARRLIVTSREAVLTIGILLSSCIHNQYTITYTRRQYNRLRLTRVFISTRNLIPLALAQAVVGSLLAVALPTSWHPGLRVGPGYYG